MKSMSHNRSNDKITYILIHGAWHARWCWKYVTPLLKSHGCNVIDPDLPGHGDDTTLLKDISLDAYVKYVIDLVKAQNNPVVLVGHSMAGVIISQVAEYIPQHIDRLIYVAAFVPENGFSLMQEARKSSSPGVSTETSIDENDNTICVNKSDRVRDLFFNCCTENDANFAMTSLQMEPFKPFVDPIQISNEKFGSVKKTYIECLNDKAVLAEDQKRMYSKIACDVISIPADHSPFFSATEDLVNIILENQLIKKNNFQKRVV